VTETDEANQTSEAVQASYQDASRFSKVVKFSSFKKFTTSAEGMDNMKAVAENEVTEILKNFLESSLPKVCQ